MPVGQERLYGLPGPQNSAVLMDIISKLKQDLQHSRSDNSKLAEQLNCLISLVKRAWSGEQGAMLHLANIVGMEPPNFVGSEMNRNTPMPLPDKSRAVKNWERFAVKLLEREYAAIQHEIQQRQKAHIMNRQMYMNDVLDDHKQEMDKLHLHKNSTVSVEDVDRQFVRCFSSKNQHEKRAKSAYRPKSGYRGTMSRAADMVERTEVKVEDLLGQQAQAYPQPDSNVFNGLYKMTENERLLYRPREHFDDPNRYKQNHLFDPDVIFSPEMMGSQGKSRPNSASEYGGIGRKSSLKTRPVSTVFITEGKPDRPLKYETTRPISGKRRPVSGTPANRGRLHSAPTRRAAPATISKKDLHSKSATDCNDQASNADSEDNIPSQLQNGGNEYWEDTGAPNGSFTEEDQDEADEQVQEKPPMSVKVKKSHPMDKFVEELKLMNDMESDFKKSAMQLQKKLGLESSGFIF